MAQTVGFSCFLLPLLLISTLVQARPKDRILCQQSRARAFIQLQCQSTLYPNLCVRDLSSYTNKFITTPSHRKLAQLALKVNLARAESTQVYVTRVAKGLSQARAKGYQVVKQCLDQINDGVDQLKNSMEEIQKIKDDGGSGREFNWHASNVQTWMSTAVTDTSMCLDGFAGWAVGGRTKAMIKAKVANLQQATSNALALFNRFAARYRLGHAKKP